MYDVCLKDISCIFINTSSFCYGKNYGNAEPKLTAVDD